MMADTKKPPETETSKSSVQKQESLLDKTDGNEKEAVPSEKPAQELQEQTQLGNRRRRFVPGASTFPIRRVLSVPHVLRRPLDLIRSKSEGTISAPLIVTPMEFSLSVVLPDAPEKGLMPSSSGETEKSLCKAGPGISLVDGRRPRPQIRRQKSSDGSQKTTSEKVAEPEVSDEPAAGSTSEVVTENGPEENPTVGKLDNDRIPQTVSASPRDHVKRSLSDAVPLPSDSCITKEELRKTRSYTFFPHIKNQEEPEESSETTVVHRTSSFRLMPHLSHDLIPDLDFPTVSVLKLCNSHHQDAALDSESESDLSGSSSLTAMEEDILHSWRRPWSRRRSQSEPTCLESLPRLRTWSLPDNDGNLSFGNETIHRVVSPPARLQFPSQPLEKLKEEASACSRGESLDSIRPRSSSVMSAVEDCDDDASIDRLISSEHVLAITEEVTDHWTNRERRRSLLESPSVSIVTPIEEVDEDGDEQQEDETSSVESTVNLWKAKDVGRRATLASVSPLTDSPKYASEIEQEAFRKIKKWKAGFALKLDKVLGRRFEEKTEDKDELKQKKPKVFKVPMHLSEEEMRQMKSNLILELKRKSVVLGEDGQLNGGVAPTPPPPPIPRVRFPRKPTAGQSPVDLRAQMLKELSNRVSAISDSEESVHCVKPTAVVPNLQSTSAHSRCEEERYASSVLGIGVLDPNSVSDLLRWHENERARMRKELEKLPQAKGGKKVLIDRDDVNKALESMMKIMEDIFMGTMKRFMGSDEPEIDVTIGKKETISVVGERERVEGTAIDETRESTSGESRSDHAQNDKRRGRLVFFPTSKVSNQSTDIYSSESSCEQITSGSSLTGITCSSSSGVELNVKNEIAPDNKEPTGEVIDLLANHLLDKPSLEENTREVIGMSANHLLDELSLEEHTREVIDMSAKHHLDKASLETKVVESSGTSESASPSSFSSESEETVEAADRDEPVPVDSIEIAFSPRESQEIPVDSTLGACSQEESQNVGTESQEANLEPAGQTNSQDVICDGTTRRTLDQRVGECEYQCDFVMARPEEHSISALGNVNTNVISIENQIQERPEHSAEDQVWPWPFDFAGLKVQYLQNDLQSSRDNADYWFKESVARREKIEELLVQMRTVSSSNYHLRQEINSMSEIIHDKDEELKRLVDSNARNENLLRELREKLSDATKENCCLQSLLRENDENKQRCSLMAGGMGEQKPSTSLGKELRGGTHQREVSEGAPTDHVSREDKADCETPCCYADAVELEEVFSREAKLGLDSSSRETKLLSTSCQERFLEDIADHQAESGVVDFVENGADSPTPDVVMSSSRDFTLMSGGDAGENAPTGRNASVKTWLNDLFHRAKSELAQDWMKICFPEEAEEMLTNLTHDDSGNKVITANEEKKSEEFPTISIKDGHSFLEERSASDGNPCVQHYVLGPSSSQDRVEESVESVPLPNAWQGIMTKSLDGVFAQLPFKSEAAGIPEGCNVDVVLSDTKPAHLLSNGILGPVEPFGEVHTPWIDPTTTRKTVTHLNADEMERCALMELGELTSSEEQQPGTEDISDDVPASEMATDELFGAMPEKSDSFSFTASMFDPESLAFLSKGGVFGSETVSDEEIKPVGNSASAVMPSRKPLMGSKATPKRDESELIQKRSEERKWRKQVLPRNSNFEPTRDVCQAENQGVVDSLGVGMSYYGRNFDQNLRSETRRKKESQGHDSLLITSDDNLTEERNACDDLSRAYNSARRDRRPLFEALDSLVKRLEGKTKPTQKIPNQDVILGSKSSKSPSDPRGFLDFISVEIKLNKEMLITELQKEGFLKIQEPETSGVESDERKAVDDVSECNRVSDRLRQMTGGDDSSGLVTLPEARTHGTSGFTKGFCAEFLKQRKGFMAERARSDMTDVIGRRSGRSIEDTGAVTNTDICSEMMHTDESIHVREEDRKWSAPRKTKYLLGAPSEALSWINKQIRATHKSVLGKDKRRYDVDKARSQNKDVTEGHGNGETARKGSSDRRKAERNSRLAKWQAKRDGVRDLLGERLVELINEKRHQPNENDPVKAREREKTKDICGFPGRSSQKVFSFADDPMDKQFKPRGRPNKAKPSHHTEGQRSADTTDMSVVSDEDDIISPESDQWVEPRRDLTNVIDSSFEEKGNEILVSIYKATQELLRRNKSQEKAIRKCQDNVHFITEEVKSLRLTNAGMGTTYKGGRMEARNSRLTENNTATRLF